MSEDLTAEASLSLADSCFVDEEYEEALDAYSAAVLLSKESEQGLRFRALSHKAAAFIQLGRNEEAVEECQAAIECASGGGLRSGESEVNQKRLGTALLRLFQYQDALNAFEQASQLASLNHRDQSKYENLILHCQKKLKPSPKTDEKVAPSATARPAEKAPPLPAVAASKPKPVPAAVVKPGAAAPATARRPTIPKYQYYQNDKFVTISILEPNVQQGDVRVDFSPRKLTVSLKKQGVDFTVISGRLFGEVNVEKCKVVIKDEKVLVKLRKTSPSEWHELLGRKGDDDDAVEAKVADTADTPTERAENKTIPRPYASHKDWNSIEKTIEEQEKNEKPEGDEAMNALFQQIYSTADEDTRRAMVKSFQTSGGTVLSTNWDEVKDKDYEKERTAPKGVEWKNWEGDKLPQTD